MRTSSTSQSFDQSACEPLANSHVVVVDDDEVIGQAVSNMLTRAGASVSYFTRADGVIAFLKQLKVEQVTQPVLRDDTQNNTQDKTEQKRTAQPVDVIVTDWMMDDIDGLELIEAVNQLDDSIGTVLMTSHASHDINRKAKASGADGFLRKPFKADACVMAALDALRSRNQQQDEPDLLLD